VLRNFGVFDWRKRRRREWTLRNCSGIPGMLNVLYNLKLLGNGTEPGFITIV
jgi:hypothetical protein